MTVGNNQKPHVAKRVRLALKWIVALGFLAGAGLFCLFFHLEKPGDMKPPATHPGPVAVPAEGPPPGEGTTNADEVVLHSRRELGLSPGDRLIYDVSQSSETSISLMLEDRSGNTSPESHDTHIVLRQSGQLVLDVLSETNQANEPNGWLVQLSMRDLSVQAQAGKDLDADTLRQMKNAQSALEAEITGSSVLAMILPYGRIDKMVPVSLETATAKMQWKDILSRWQFVFPDVETNAWTQTESDTLGTYIAEYSGNLAKEPKQINKRKTSYADISASIQGGGALNPHSSVMGDVNFTLDPYQIAIRGHEEVTVVDGSNIKANTKTTFAINLNSKQVSPIKSPAISQAMAVIATETNILSWAAERADFIENSQVKTKEDINAILDLLQELFRLGEGHDGQEVQLAAVLINAIQSGDASAVSAIMDALTDDFPTDEYGAALIGILGAAGTPDSQMALIDIIQQQDWPSEFKQYALQSIVQIADPIGAVDECLKSIHAAKSEYSNEALLALAAVGDHLRSSNQARRDAILHYVLGQENDPDKLSCQDLSIALSAIGNLGPDDVPDLVSQALIHEDPFIREQAISSLRRIHTQAATDLILHALDTDQDDAVRIAAIELLGDPTRTGGLDNLRQVLTNEPGEQVRMAALSSIVGWQDEYPESVEKIIRDAASQDPSSQVREHATSLLSQYSNR